MKLLLFTILGLAAMCENLPQELDKVETLQLEVRLEKVVTGLDSPWAIEFLPDGEWLITDKTGTLYRSKPGEALKKVSGLPDILVMGQGGLLDVKAHPKFAENQIIYMSYSSETGGSRSGNTQLMRATLSGTTLSDQKVIFTATPASGSNVHFGSRIAFDDEGYLYITVGERGKMENAQTLANHSGKVHRLNDDGTIPADNPFVNEDGAISSIFSYGHRNPQGMVYDRENDILWTHEHGPRGGDELNSIRKGANYGWPEITYGINYNGTIITDQTHKEGMEQPNLVWTPSIAPCGLERVTSDRYPQWKGNLLVGSLSFTHVRRVILNGQEVTGEEELFKGIGRVREIAESPDGWLYVAIENPGEIYRIVPVTR